jgi:hypothetical protein
MPPRLPEPPFGLKDLLQPVRPAAAVANTPEEILAMRNRAGQDLTDIAALRASDPFNNFFVRRVRQKRDAALMLLVTDKCDAETREGHRQKVLALEDCRNMLAPG